MGVPNVPPMRSDTHPIPPVSIRSRDCGDGQKEGGEKPGRNDFGHFNLEGENPVDSQHLTGGIQIRSHRQNWVTHPMRCG